MTTSEELKFQVDLAKLQVEASVIFGLGIALTATGIGVFVGLVNVRDFATLTSLLQVSLFLIIAGYVVLYLFGRNVKKRLDAKKKEAENWKD